MDNIQSLYGGLYSELYLGCIGIAKLDRNRYKRVMREIYVSIINRKDFWLGKENKDRYKTEEKYIIDNAERMDITNIIFYPFAGVISFCIIYEEKVEGTIKPAYKYYDIFDCGVELLRVLKRYKECRAGVIEYSRYNDKESIKEILMDTDIMAEILGGNEA